MSAPSKRKYSSGLTLVEVLIVAPIVVLVIGIFVGTIIYLTGDVISTRVSNNQSYMIQDALDRIEQDVKLSTNFLATNNITLTSPQGYSDDTTSFDNVSTTTNPMLILKMFAISKPPSDQSRNILYTVNTPNSCTSGQVDQNEPLYFNVVYFVKNNNLIRRVIAQSDYAANSCDPSTQTIVTPWQVPTCTTGYSATFCKSTDETLVTGITSASSFAIKYYIAGSITEVADASDSSKTDSQRQTALDTVDMVNATISSTVSAAGRDVNESGTMRATKYNLKN